MVRAARWAKVPESSGLPDGQKCLSGQGYEVVKSVIVVRAAKWSGLPGDHNGKIGSGLPSGQGCQVVKCLRGVRDVRWSNVSEVSGLTGGKSV